MNAARKTLPPIPGGDDLAEALRNRLRRGEEADPGAATSITSTTSATSTRGSTSRTSASSATVPMDRRSWYMPRHVADALAAAVQEIYWSSHRPKHEVLAALVETALAHRDEVTTRLDESSH